MIFFPRGGKAKQSQRGRFIAQRLKIKFCRRSSISAHVFTIAEQNFLKLKFISLRSPAHSKNKECANVLLEKRSLASLGG